MLYKPVVSALVLEYGALDCRMLRALLNQASRRSFLRASGAVH